jgi:hypothetical protein
MGFLKWIAVLCLTLASVLAAEEPHVYCLLVKAIPPEKGYVMYLANPGLQELSVSSATVSAIPNVKEGKPTTSHLQESVELGSGVAIPPGGVLKAIKLPRLISVADASDVRVNIVTSGRQVTCQVLAEPVDGD